MRSLNHQDPRRLGLMIIVLLTLLWGSTFWVVKQTVATLPPSLLNGVRFTLAGLCVIPFLQWSGKIWRAGLELGLWLMLGYATQTIGLQFTSVSRSAFITALYVVFVPLLLLLSRDRRRAPGAGPGRKTGDATLWMAAGLALFGVGCLSWDGSPPNWGDLWTVLTALGWSGYIWRLEHHSQRLPILALTAAQLWATAALSFLWIGVDWPPRAIALDTSPVTWTTTWAQILPHLPALLYLGILATGLTVLLQTWAQQYVPAGQAAVLYTLEPVWATLFAMLLNGERLGLQGLVGAIAILLAALLSQRQSRA